MKNRRQTIRKIVGFLNNKEEDGGFWLPNIQRPFVWGEDQICRLFDSILREYPISTLLVWKTTNKIRRRKFIDNWQDSLRPRLSIFYVNEDEAKKCLVLDGQQRLQSLFIGLCGSFNSKELCLNILSGEIAAPDDIKYEFKFIEPDAIAFPWVNFKTLVFTERKKRVILKDLEDAAGRELDSQELDKIEDHLDLVDKTFKMDEAITYQELDSIDNPDLYKEDDVVEVFIRANSGGTVLGKSDLLFSLLTASWEVADKSMEDLLETLNRHGFAFDRDFILKTCLLLLGQGARYEVSKFRREGVREEIEEKWSRIADAVMDVLDFVRGKTFIQCDKALPSYLVLMPLVILRYHFPKAWKTAKGIDAYLLRCSLVGAFSGQADRLLDALDKRIKISQAFDLDEIFALIRSQGRSLELTEDRFWQMGYGSKTIHLLFNIWYQGINYTPAYQNNMLQVDHIFPQCALKAVKEVNPETGRMRMKYYEPDRNQLANCMLLSRDENGPGGKWDTLPKDWFADKDDAYLDRHLIPKNSALWEMDQFENFIEERKKLIAAKFSNLIVPSAKG
ncbi:GmrSD restriction endonuclease domain-containing protein [Desulfatibacillum aliphaticivorans]|uniref:GmrSD restriction endonuclease domain-containing protein n=1 Tax=Desulfatibacillum aliphaticivorans TaxID=218208 RepID=UPI000405E249|nr:DUF262 domain-containing protein [Desulfatibacillum aliphaticivorans]